MAWLELDLSLGVRRFLAMMLAAWNMMMGCAGFGLLITGLVLQSYISALVEPASRSSTTAATITSVMWYSYAVITLGAIATLVYTFGTQVSITSSLLAINSDSTKLCVCHER